MRLKPKINIKRALKKLKAWLCRAPRLLAQRAFWVFVIFFIIEVLFGLAVFFYYSFPRGDVSEEIMSFSQGEESIERVAQEILERRTQIDREYFELFPILQKVD